MRFVYSSDLQQSYSKVQVNFVLEDIQQRNVFPARHSYGLLHGAAFFSTVFIQMVLLGGVCFLSPGTILNEHSNQDLSWYISTPGQATKKLQLPSYFCPHIKSVNEELLLFGLMPLAGITFFVTLTSCSVQCSSRRW